MAANDVQIRIRAEDFASSVLNRVAGSANQATSSLDSLGRTARGFVFNAAGVAAGIAGFQGLSAAIEGTANSVFNFTKSMETNELGMAGILSSMTQINGRNLQWNEAMGISKSIIAQLNDEALKTSATSEELVTTFRALLAPGLSAGMKIAEIKKLTSVGVNAVKSIGLNNMQLVQELRDLVQGGIQPASSTLATALGLKDKDIKAAKESTQGLFNFLMERMQGFEMASMATQNTFQGKMDQIKEGMTRIGSEGTMPLFEGAKAVLNDVANQLIHIETEGEGASLKLKSVTLNQDLINDLRYASNQIIEFGASTKETVTDLWAMAVPIGQALSPALSVVNQALALAGSNVRAIGAGMAIWYAGGKLIGMYTSIAAVTNTATVANSLLGRSIQSGIIAYKSRQVAAQTAAQAEMAAAMGVSATMRSAEAARLAAIRNTATVQAAATSIAAAGNTALSSELTTLRAQYIRLGASAEQAGIMQMQAARMAATGNAVLTAELIAQQRAHLVAAAAARTSGISTVTAMGTAAAAIRGVGAAVFALMGGWLGVATAIGIATVALINHESEKWRVDSYNPKAEVRLNPETGKYEKKVKMTDEQMREARLRPDGRPLTSLGYLWIELSEAENEDQKKYNYEHSPEYAEDMKKESDRKIAEAEEKAKKQSEELDAKHAKDTAVAAAATAAKDAEKAAKEAKEETIFLRNNIIDNTGQFLGRDYGGSSIDDWDKVCTTFIQSIWNAAGVANAEGLTAWAPNWKDNLGNAYHAADGGYQPLPGDAALIDYDGDGKADHVVMVDENQTGYYAASKPGTQSHHGKDLYGAFGKNIMGYGSASEYAGISPGAKAYDRERAAAFKEAYQLSREMQSGINKESGTEYSQGMYTANQDILSKQHKIGRLKEQGVDTTELTKQLETYSAAVKGKVTEKWQQSWQTLQDDTKKAQAEIIGDTTVFADAQYQATVKQLDHERKDRQNAVMQNKNDKVAAIAVDQWYNSQLVLAQQKRNSVYREEGLLKYNQRVEANTRLVLLEGKTQAEIDILNEQELKSKIIFLDIELQTANLKKDERIAIEKEKCDTIKELNEIAGRDMDNAVGVHLEEIRKQTTNWTGVYDSAFSSIENSLLDNLNSMTSGAESFSSGFVNIFDNMAKEIQKIWIKMWYEQTILKPFTNWWEGILGGFTGKSGGGVNLGSTQGTLITGGMWGSGQNWTSPNGPYNFNSTPKPAPYFAKGGEHSGGWAVVGEEGPELAYFGSRAHIYDAKKSKNILGADTNKETPNITINLINKTATEAKASATSKFDNLGNMIIQVIVDAIPQNRGGIQDMISAVSKSR